MFRSKWSNLVGSWCVDFYRRYQVSPGREIEAIYRHWAETSESKDVVDLVGKFLQGLSDQYEDTNNLNSKFTTDIADRHFNKVKVERLIEELQGDVDVGKVEDAMDRVRSYKPVALNAQHGIDALRDKQSILNAFDGEDGEPVRPLVRYPGDLGKFFGDSFCRDSFVSFLGPEKSGKTWWILDVVYRSLLERRKVLLFEVGDMSQDQVLRRLMVRVARHPIKPGKVSVPTRLIVRRGDSPELETREEIFEHGLSGRRAIVASKKFIQQRLKMKEMPLMLSTHPNNSLSVYGLQSILKSLAQDGWVPDVVAIDYADVLLMDQRGMEQRDRINDTWKTLRGISQEFHCLVVTATQANAASYDREVLGMDNFSEDKRKLSHVTGMVGINKPGEGDDTNIVRLNWIVRREEEFFVQRVIHVARCLQLGNPAVKSAYQE
jgi:hypothetical protein